MLTYNTKYLLTGCYKFGDPLNDEQDSLHSDEESTGRHDDSDEFADDEAMSNPDSSSQVLHHFLNLQTSLVIFPIL
jgi:hypothetical protein